MESRYVALLECSQEIKFINMLLQEILEVQKLAVAHKDNSGAIFLVNNSQVGICIKHINIHHQCLWIVIEEKDMNMKYIRSEENPTDIMTKKCSKSEHVNTHKEDHRRVTLIARGKFKGE